MHQSHDKLFKAGFSDPATAAGFLRTQLSPLLSEAIDWSSLSLQPGSFIDSQFRHSESDLLFTASLAGSEAALYLLFEHQSAEDPRLALRLLRYMVRIWEKRLAQFPGDPLPVILPIVLAQNARVWGLRPDFASLLNLPDGMAAALRPFVPDFAFRLIQLAELPFEAIAGTPAGILVLRVLKAERSAQLLAGPVWDESLLGQAPRALFGLLLRYILAADIDKVAFENKLQSIQDADTRGQAMTLAQQYHQEGRQEGHEEGRQEGRKDAILANLLIRLGPVPEGLAEAVREVRETARLEALQRASLTCATFEEFSAAL